MGRVLIMIFIVKNTNKKNSFFGRVKRRRERNEIKTGKKHDKITLDKKSCSGGDDCDVAYVHYDNKMKISGFPSVFRANYVRGVNP